MGTLALPVHGLAVVLVDCQPLRNTIARVLCQRGEAPANGEFFALARHPRRSFRCSI